MKDCINKSFKVFDKEWALVTAGTADNFNTMTISWGGLGTIWNKPVATVYVKPIRYTHSFLDLNEYFTVSFYDEKYRKDLGVLGTLSGRDGDKVAKTALTPVTIGESISFKEAKMTLLCKKIYRQDLITDTMPQEAIDKYYIDEAPHTMFIGEVVDIIE
ncbi:MAG: flavin reductase [Oscillospiraceae bacterium]|nr:flavin reductase [Oscillospiraceae bacterium]